MTKLIMDPCLFEVPSNMSQDDQFAHYIILKDSIDFVSDFFHVSLDAYDGAPYIGNSESPPYAPPITKSLYIRNNYAQISKKIQKMVSRGKLIELPKASISNCSLQFEDTMTAEIKFKQYLFLLFCSDLHENTLLLLSQKNNIYIPSITLSVEDSTYELSTIFDPAVDCNGIVAKYLMESLETNSIFPQFTACTKLNERFKEEISRPGLTVNERKAIYISLGTEVANRNNYHAKPDISRKNPHYEVFVHSTGRFYLSIDLEHGALEVFRSQGKHPSHLGEYDFSCVQTKAADPKTHKLVV